jgi:hypothetical protein
MLLFGIVIAVKDASSLVVSCKSVAVPRGYARSQRFYKLLLPLGLDRSEHIAEAPHIEALPEAQAAKDFAACLRRAESRS